MRTETWVVKLKQWILQSRMGMLIIGARKPHGKYVRIEQAPKYVWDFLSVKDGCASEIKSRRDLISRNVVRISDYKGFIVVTVNIDIADIPGRHEPICVLSLRHAYTLLGEDELGMSDYVCYYDVCEQDGKWYTTMCADFPNYSWTVHADQGPFDSEVEALEYSRSEAVNLFVSQGLTIVGG